MAPRQKTIGITMGDPAGIGPEIVIKSLQQSKICKLGSFCLIGDLELFKHYGLKSSPNITVYNVPIQGVLALGKLSKNSGKAALDCLETSVRLLRERKIQALVTSPVAKESVALLAPRFTGHTEYLAEAFKIRQYEMMFVTPTLKTVILTRHVPLKDVHRYITKQSVLATIQLVHRELKGKFKIRNPRIAVCGLNPHAGEGGLIGKEEVNYIIPAIKKARSLGVTIDGPFAADTLFKNRAQQFDAVIAMYHDQGLIAAKTLHFDDLVNLTIGLPFVRTSPAHGTAFDIAGKNKADAASMGAAIRLAAEIG